MPRRYWVTRCMNHSGGCSDFWEREKKEERREKKEKEEENCELFLGRWVMLVLVTYDIPDDKRRLKLANLLEGYGRRVQFSVFECFLTLDEMRLLHQKVQKRVKAAEDNVRFYWISEDAVKRILTIGSSPPEPPPNAYIL
jgi:CRISPR-associated protein Cas2